MSEQEGNVPACFRPRHGIHATRGQKVVDLLVCFECSQVEVYSGGSDQPSLGLRTSGSPEPVFDKALRDAGIPLAPKAE